jgi:hypothetical protein
VNLIVSSEVFRVLPRHWSMAGMRERLLLLFPARVFFSRRTTSGGGRFLLVTLGSPYLAKERQVEHLVVNPYIS